MAGVVTVSVRLEVGTNTLPAPVVDMADAGDVPEELLVIVPVPVIAALTVIVQLAPAAAIAPVKVRVPEVAATVPAVPPAQMTLGTPKVMVPGPVTVSVKLLMLSALVLDALVIVMVSVDASLLYTVEGETAWLIDTGELTVRLAAPGVPLRPRVLPMAPGASA